MGVQGLIPGVLASIVEHFEFPPCIDDNLLIAGVTTLLILFFTLL